MLKLFYIVAALSFVALMIIGKPQPDTPARAVAAEAIQKYRGFQITNNH
jgi:hypothetical protein